MIPYKQLKQLPGFYFLSLFREFSSKNTQYKVEHEEGAPNYYVAVEERGQCWSYGIHTLKYAILEEVVL